MTSEDLLVQKINVQFQEFHKAVEDMKGSLAQLCTQMVSLNHKHSEFHALQERHAAGLAHVSGRLQKIEGALRTPTTLAGSSDDSGEIVDSVMMEENSDTVDFGDP